MTPHMLCPLSGGNANNGTNAGVWALILNNSRANSNANVGLRADLSKPGLRAVMAYWPEKGASFRPSAKSAGPGVLVAPAKIRPGLLS